jgi:hypothetical protein
MLPREEVKFLIYAPPYQNWSAGGRVLHRLCHLLNVIGHDAAIPYWPNGQENRVNPDWRTPYITNPEPDRVVVFPEVVSGNPLAAPHVVRYVMNHPGLLAGDTRYADGEVVIYYDDWLRKSASQATPIYYAAKDGLLDQEHRLCISVIDPSEFYSDCSVPKKHDATYVGRGEPLISARFTRKEFSDTSLPVYPITRNDPPTRWELGNFLRATRTLYTMDSRSAICVEAKACGAKVVYVTGAVEHAELTSEQQRDLTDEIDIRNLVLDYQRTDHVRRFAALVKERFG